MPSFLIPGTILLSAILLSTGLRPAPQSPVQPAPAILNPSASPARNQPAPAVKKLKAADLQAYIAQCDHPLIVSFWATYCQPCIKEIPYFQNTVAKYKNQGVEFLLVSLDPPGAYPARIAAWAQKNGYTASLAWLNETDPAHCSPAIDKNWSGGLPSSLFVNSKTHYRQFFDRQLTDLQVEPAIKAMLAP